MAKEAGLYGGGTRISRRERVAALLKEMSLDGTRTQSGEPGVEDGDRQRDDSGGYGR